MKKTGHNRGLDCIAMKRRIQQEIARETEGMTPAQRLAYVKEQVRKSPFADLLANRTTPPNAPDERPGTGRLRDSENNR